MQNLTVYGWSASPGVRNDMSVHTNAPYKYVRVCSLDEGKNDADRAK